MFSNVLHKDLEYPSQLISPALSDLLKTIAHLDKELKLAKEFSIQNACKKQGCPFW